MKCKEGRVYLSKTIFPNPISQPITLLTLFVGECKYWIISLAMRQIDPTLCQSDQSTDELTLKGLKV